MMVLATLPGASLGETKDDSKVNRYKNKKKKKKHTSGCELRNGAKFKMRGHIFESLAFKTDHDPQCCPQTSLFV